MTESFILTGRQGVCVVSVETPASGKSRLDPGCQFGGWAVSGFIFLIATWEAQQLNITLSHKWRKICVKVIQGFFFFKHLGHSTGVRTDSGADADLSPLIPILAVQTMETLLMKTLFLCCSYAGQLKQSCQMLVFTGYIVRLSKTSIARQLSQMKKNRSMGTFKDRGLGFFLMAHLWINKLWLLYRTCNYILFITEVWTRFILNTYNASEKFSMLILLLPLLLLIIIKNNDTRAFQPK